MFLPLAHKCLFSVAPAFQTVAKFTKFCKKTIFLHALSLRKKVKPSVLADSEDQEKISCFSIF